MTHCVSYRSRGSVDARGSNPRLKGFDYVSDGSGRRRDGAAVVGSERGAWVGCKLFVGGFCLFMGGFVR